MTDQQSKRMIGVSAPEAAKRDRVNIPVWDCGDATNHASQLGIAAFTVREARAFAAKLIQAADDAEAQR